MLTAYAHVVQVHVLTCAYIARREADDLVVAAHRRARSDRARSEFVAGRNQTDNRHTFVLDERAGD